MLSILIKILKPKLDKPRLIIVENNLLYIYILHSKFKFAMNFIDLFTTKSHVGGVVCFNFVSYKKLL